MKSIKRYLMMGLVGGAMLLMGIAGPLLFFHVRSILISDFDGALRAKAQALSSLARPEDGVVEFDFAGEFLPEFERHKDPEYFQAWFPDGKCIKKSSSLGNGVLFRIGAPLNHPIFVDLDLPDGRSGRAIGLCFIVQPESKSENKATTIASGPIVTLVVARSRVDLDRMLMMFRTELALAGILFMSAIALLVAVVVRKGLAPLGQLAEKASAIEASSLHMRFPTDSMPLELRPVSQKLNDLLIRLEESFRRERQFSADMAHELRTPIAELRTLAELAIKWPNDATVAMFRDALTIAQRMETSVAGLLTLSRCEEGKQPVARESMIVADLVKEIWAPLAETARQKKIEHVLEVPGNLLLNTDKSLFRLILTNLLANAVEYTPIKGRIRLSANVCDEVFNLVIMNTTDNLGAEDVPHLFERLWRKDKARTDSEHSGLGLSLARAAATVMGMTLVADIPENGILCITLKGSVNEGTNAK